MDNDRNHDIQYRMPPLTDEFLYQMIFCMEDQANEYCLDLKEGTLVQEEFIEQRKEEEPQRFLEIPQWFPSDGFRTMEKFVSTLRNPVYRERLRDVLQSGKGVFRQFKDVLHDFPPLERLWFYYKDKEIRHKIHLWYERNDEAFRLARLGDAPEDGPENLLLEDFQFVNDPQPWIETIHACGERLIHTLRSGGSMRGALIADELSAAWQPQEGQQYLIALANGEKFAGFVTYRIGLSNVIIVDCYAIEEEFQGLGLMKLMVELLAQDLYEKGFIEMIFTFVGDSMKIEPMFDDVSPISVSKKISVPLDHWNSNKKVHKDPDCFV